MEKHQELEWAEAQKIVISEDLVAAAKQQLQFLATVDKNHHLYGGPALERAIYRYKSCWLPLLAKQGESQFHEGPLVVPLDCEWIWHCHRLNPIRYVTDCKELYGRILDTRNVVSSTRGTSKEKTEEIWKMMYPNESYELDMSGHVENAAENILVASLSPNYDLVSAVKRQSPFHYQVSKSCMNDDLFLQGAVERYKGFLHLIRRNMERKMKQFCVPTYDIDLIWHSHQLQPISYCKDLVVIIGKVLEHNDMDSKRSKGEKLDVGFCETTKQWEETFGSRYWRAGAMYRGSAPSPLANLWPSNTISKKVAPLIEYQDVIQLPKTMLVEVLLEIVGIRNLPAGHKSNLLVSISKKQPDLLFSTKRRLSILSEMGEKKVASFQCEPTGELRFELVSYSPSNDLSRARSPEILGNTSVSLQDLLNPVSKLSVEKWFELVPNTGIVGSKPISLRIAVSVTAPIPAPYVLQMVWNHPISRSSSFFPLPERVQQAKKWTSVIDEAWNEVINIQMRDSKKLDGNNNCSSKKEVIGMSRSGEICVLAEFASDGWLLMGYKWIFQLQNKVTEEDYMFELAGSKKITVFHGRKGGYEIKSCNKKRNEGELTLVEFSDEDSCGKEVALLNLRSGFLKVEEHRLVLPVITLAFILSDILKKEGYGFFTTKGGMDVEAEIAKEVHEVMPINDGPYSGKCGNEIGTVLKGFACGEYGSGRENMVKSHCLSGCTGAGACGGSGGCSGGGCGGGGGCRGSGCHGGCGGGACNS